MYAIRPTRPVPARRADAYRAEHLWDDRRLRDGLELAAARRPDAVAVVDRRCELSWRQLAHAVNAGVGVLRDSGVRSGEAVVLVSGNTVEGVVAYHALLRVGATAVVLDRRCGAADLRAALRVAGSGATVVLPEDLARGVEGLGELRSLALGAFAPRSKPTGAAPGWSEPDRDAPALVLFTSGTTSEPKAVIHSLNTLTAGARNLALITGADADTVPFLVSPLTSIAGIVQMHLVADRHGALVLEDRFDAEESLDRIEAHGANWLGGAPVIAERLLRAATDRGDGRIGLRTLALGGAMLPRPLLERATDAFGLEVCRVYGSSEAPNTSGSLPGDERGRRLADDGAPTPGAEVRVGSRAHAREALVRGPAVFLGYVDPRDTEASFEEDWYRTGDAVERNDGRLVVTGRLKEVVKRNGLEISLSEVDGALAGLPGAIEVACFGLADESTGERLVVAVRTEEGRAATLDAVTAYLRERGLASRKLPEQLVVWDEPLPRTASGKVLRSRLALESSGRPSWLRSPSKDPSAR